MKPFGLLTLTALALAACADPSGPAATTPAPARHVAAARGATIADRYVVVLREGTDVDAEAARLAAKHGGRIERLYHAALRGLVIDLPEAAATALANEPSVALVEPDQAMSIVTTQNAATWGLDRIDQRALPTNGTYTYDATGAGVTVYIIDTGIRYSHGEFGGRAVFGADEVTAGGDGVDCNGHGTHVSGTVGGATYGVAKGVKLVGVRVLDCDGSGSTSGVIAGIDWVTADHNAKHTPAAANMSLGGSASTALDNAVANSIAAGVTYGIAAGNGNIFGIAQNACNSSPSRVAAAITVSATDNADTKANWANYGTCVDIFAPGVNITSSWNTNDGATNTISGTSMATPHVVGAAALYLETNPSATPAQVATALTTNATTNAVKNGGSGSPDRLLYTAFIGGGSNPPPAPPAPVASFTSSCSGRNCTFNASATTNATAYAWTFGDGSTGTGVTTSHSFAPNDTYTVTLTATGAGGANSTSKTITCNKKNCS